MEMMDRGDPRMNQAVIARLKNPVLSLFECLSIGGFAYACDNGSAMDCDSVALAQRKNQLNRRLRRVRKRSNSRSKDASPWSSPSAASSPCATNYISDYMPDPEVSLSQLHETSGATTPESDMGTASRYEVAAATSNLAAANVSLQEHLEVDANQTATMGQAQQEAPMTPNFGETIAHRSSMSTSDIFSDSAVADPRQELALTYFEREPHAVYQRCMLSAGYSLEDCQDMSSEAYRKFAFVAWRRECERLQALMAKYDTQVVAASI